MEEDVFLGKVRMQVSEVREGMVLAQDLLAPNGRRILPAGAQIKASYLQTMKVWGVSELVVEGDGGEESAVLSPAEEELRQKAEARVSRFFAAANQDHEAMGELRRLCAVRVAESLEKNPLAMTEEPPGQPETGSAAQGKKPALSDLVQREVQLCSFPDIYFRIKEVLDSPRSSATHVADVVSKDTSLSAKLLRLVNSAFYGFPSRIDSISRAVTVIGSNELSTLALGISAINLFKDIPPNCVNMRSFWEHSVACGVYARMLAFAKKSPYEERFFVGGLLHDIGRLILFRRYPNFMAQALYLSKERTLQLFEAEGETFDFSHAVVGGLVLSEWKLPPVVADMVRYHHNPVKAPALFDAAVLHLADIIAGALRRGSSGSFFVPALDDEAWKALNLPVSVLESTIAQGERQIREIIHAFFGEEK